MGPKNCFVFSLGTNKPGSAIANVFLRAPKGSIYNRIYENQMATTESFIPTKDGVALTSLRDDYAYFQQDQFVLAYSTELECQVKITN